MKLVTAAIIRDGENILVVRRGPREKLAGFWEFPGGKVEHPETLQECLERELFEELDNNECYFGRERNYGLTIVQPPM
jgi:8-oxo-dGTP diphosphatase